MYSAQTGCFPIVHSAVSRRGNGMTRVCGALGCTNDATRRISVRGSERVVCDDHAEGHQTIGFVGGESA